MTSSGKELEPHEVQGSALVALLLSATTLRFLRKKGALEQEELSQIFGAVASHFESSEFVSDANVHAARVLLTSLANSMGVPLKHPN